MSGSMIEMTQDTVAAGDGGDRPPNRESEPDIINPSNDGIILPFATAVLVDPDEKSFTIASSPSTRKNMFGWLLTRKSKTKCKKRSIPVATVIDINGAIPEGENDNDNEEGLALATREESFKDNRLMYWSVVCILVLLVITNAIIIAKRVAQTDYLHPLAQDHGH